MMIKKMLVLFIILFFIFNSQSAMAAKKVNGMMSSPGRKEVSKSGKETASLKNKVSGEAVGEGYKNFQKGYKYFEKKDYKKACPYFYKYMKDNSPDVEEYEWAEFFLGVSLKKLGYTHASVDILSHLITRKPNQKIVTYSLEIFEKIIRTIPFDRDIVINKTICDQDYGFVQGELSDFINFYQGVYDWQHGFFDWGEEHFSKIRKNSYYFYKYRYQLAKYFIYKDQIDESISILKGIMESDCDRADLRDEVRKTLARLLYEKSELKEADQLYRDIEKHILEQSENLLELAWVHYRLGHPEKAMGLLYAFEAPSYKNSFTPEYYILKSFIYKDVCHYQRALDVVTGFRERYGTSLENIYQRGKPEENYPLMLVLLGKDHIRRTWKFLDLLADEKAHIKEFKDSAFCFYLNKIYDIQIKESTYILRSQIDASYEEMANQLLKYEEESYLMAYEIGLDMYQRVYQSHYREPSENTNLDKKGIAVYPFQGEFWNDELADYKVNLPDKCNKMEEWDIFFK